MPENKPALVNLDTGKSFRRNAEKELASVMARYAMWFYYEKENRNALDIQDIRVSLDTGRVQFITPVESVEIQVPNHKWQPIVIEYSAP